MYKMTLAVVQRSGLSKSMESIERGFSWALTHPEYEIESYMTYKTSRKATKRAYHWAKRLGIKITGVEVIDYAEW